MITFVVVENPSDWPFAIPDIEVVSARSYLLDPRFANVRRAAVFNMCRHYAYQRTGYYVSLLAAARGHRVLPSVDALQALRILPLARIASEDLDALIQRSLSRLRSKRFDLRVYLGRNVARRYDQLAQALFDLYPVPFLRATFVADPDWRLHRVRAIGTADIPAGHREFVIDRTRSYLTKTPRANRPRPARRYDLAILWNPDDPMKASDRTAIDRFVRAARKVDLEASVIDAADYGRIAEFDALFIRETTLVNHYTYRMARRAESEGLIVIDDPESIVRCTNKVFQAELFRRHRIRTPPTLVVHQGNVGDIPLEVGLPCVLKQPDSSFSAGVVRIESAEDLEARVHAMLDESELVVAQTFMPTAFDWRIGVLDGRGLFACKYHMAKGHWQIIQGGGTREGHPRFGRVRTMAVGDAPAGAVSLAEQATSPIGRGLYGVDIKEIDGQFFVIEVNDNPNIDAGYEDRVLGQELYLTIMRSFRDRVDAIRGRGAGG